MLITGVTKRKLRNLGYENTFGLKTSRLQTNKQDWSEKHLLFSAQNNLHPIKVVWVIKDPNEAGAIILPK